jgi:methionyl-tRNA synthetase
MRAVCEEAGRAYFDAMERYELHNAVGEVFGVVRAANRYIEEQAPWALVKQDGGKAKAAEVLFTVCEVLRNAALLLFPFMPSKARDTWRALGIDRDIGDSRFDSALSWQEEWDNLSQKIGRIKPLFPRIETAGAVSPSPGGDKATLGEKDMDLLDIEDFKKLDLRVAHIKSAGVVPGAKKLLMVNIDIGGEERQIVAGIAEHYAPEDLVGRNIIVIANLKPAKIRGVESQGMLLAATDGDRVILLVPDKEAAPGSRIS